MLDWIASLGTAIVGFTGIIATYRSGSMARISQAINLELSINAENDRCRLAEKRRIYAAFMGSASSYVAAERALSAARCKGASEKRLGELRTELNQVMVTMLTALCELRLIATEDLAIVAVNTVQRLTTSENLASEFPELRDALYEVMRTDLNEPVYERIDAPEIVAHALER